MVEDLDQQIAAMEAELGLVQARQTIFTPFNSLWDLDYASTRLIIKWKTVYTGQFSPRLASPSTIVYAPSSRRQKLRPSQNCPVLTILPASKLHLSVQQ